MAQPAAGPTLNLMIRDGKVHGVTVAGDEVVLTESQIIYVIWLLEPLYVAELPQPIGRGSGWSTALTTAARIEENAAQRGGPYGRVVAQRLRDWLLEHR